METKTALLLTILLATIVPGSAQALPLPLPNACNGSVVGCADILAPLAEPTKLIPADILPAEERDAPAATAPGAPSSAPTAASGSTAAPLTGVPAWAWMAVMAAGFALVAGAVLLLRLRAKRPRRTSYADALRALAQHEDIERALARWRADRAAPEPW